MKEVLVPQERINKLLAYRSEKVALLNSLKGEGQAQDLLRIEINTIEIALITLGIDFDK